MSVNAVKFAISSFLSFSFNRLYYLFSISVGLSGMMMATSSDMVHINLSLMGWEMSFIGILIGLVGWGLSVGAIGWLLVIIYNILL